MGWKSNMALLGAVGGMVWYLMAKGPPTAPTPAPGPLTYRLLPESIWTAAQVKIRRGKLEPIILKLDLAKGRFDVLDPVEDVASMALLKSIFRIYDAAELYEGYSVEELKKDPSLIAKVGLDDPRATVEVRYSGRTIKIDLGQPAFKDDEIYLKVGEKVFRGPKALYTSIQHNPDDLREKLMFTKSNIGDPEKIRVTRRIGKKMIVDAIEKLPKVGFRVVEPRNLRVDMSMAQGLVTTVGGLSIVRYLSGTMPEITQSEPDLILTVGGAKGEETLSVYGLGDKGTPQSPGPFLARLHERNVVFQVSGLGLRELVQWAGALRARQLVGFGEVDIKRIEIEPVGDGKKLVLVRGSADKFSMVGPVHGPVSSTPVSELLFALAHMQALQFVDEIPEAAGLGDGQGYLTVRVSGARMAAPVTIRIGKADKDGLVYARREEESTGVLLPADVVSKARRPWLDFVGTQLPKMTANIFCVEVHRPDGKALIYINRDGEWRLEGADPDSDADAELWEFVDRISNISATRALPDQVIPKGAKPVQVILRQQPFKNSAALAEYHLFAYGKTGKQVVLAPPERAGVVYLMDHPLVIKALFRRWR